MISIVNYMHIHLHGCCCVKNTSWIDVLSGHYVTGKKTYISDDEVASVFKKLFTTFGSTLVDLYVCYSSTKRIMCLNYWIVHVKMYIFTCSVNLVYVRGRNAEMMKSTPAFIWYDD
ncbi:hypothetical protein ABZP36_028985 [Zizania latifolia]